MARTVLFDRYRLLEPAGSGGSAEVWRALDLKTGDEVAVKRLHPVVFADEAGRRRLQREFDALRTLDEPHIVRVRDLHVGEREAALVLDFVDGQSLAEALAGQRPDSPALSPQRIAAIVDDIATALTAAHAAGIVHRDVTPGNILLTRDGQARLTDFGIAHASGNATAVTATGLVMGTMRYLAPEQLRGGTTTPASDLHGIAAVTYEMLAGRPAYEASSPVALAEAQANGPAPILGVPPALDAAVRHGLAVDPEDRPADVATFARSVRAALEDDRTMAIPVGGAVGALGALAADAVGVASPSRAAEVHGPLGPMEAPRDGALVGSTSEAAAGSSPAPLAVRPRSPRTARAGRRVPAPIALLLGLGIAAAAISAATSPIAGDGTSGRSSEAPAPAATPRATARPTPTPVPKAKPGKGDGDGDDKGKGDGKGKGNDD
jgi:eukaryotic-like serine/threonine-protein kinase